MLPSESLASMLGLESKVAELYDETAHHVAFLIAGRATRESAPEAAAAFAHVIALMSGDERDLFAVAVVQRLGQVIRTLATGSVNPLAENLRACETLVDAQGAQIPVGAERFLAQTAALDAAADRLRALLGGAQ